MLGRAKGYMSLMRIGKKRSLSLRPRHALIAGGAAFSLAVAGCGSSASPLAAAGNGNQAVLAAYTTTTKAKSADMTLRETIKAAGKTVTLSGSGALDFAGKRGSFSFDSGALKFKEVVLSPEVYVQLPAAARSEIPGKKSWISFNVETLSKAKLGATLSELSSSSKAPSDALSQLAAISSGGISKLGTPTINGVATTEYSARIDLAKVDTSASAKAKAVIAELRSELGHTVLPIKVWVDHQGRMRQMTYNMTITKSGQHISVSLRMDLSSFGVPVHVQAPPASETFNMTSALLHGDAGGL
jgi:hypothetical protein